ncbi:hypothetical protein F2Q69_00002427 [Brassica cretica]|uniref:Uncharacterized protein n=1 Tax=Brassica cretica TaxID=69181 RepID=A0A8S9PE88_BRACR|nr:hypothetical protein F2Q69_00002427 [Brassica cretica]
MSSEVYYRSWMDKPHLDPNTNLLTEEYVQGIGEFMRLVQQQPDAKSGELAQEVSRRSSIHTETSIRCFSIASASSIQKQLESLLSIVGGVCGEPKTSSTTVSGKSHGDSVVISNVEGKKRETRGLGCHSK